MAVKPRPISLVVHGHFYQPPRENPWTDEVPREPGASPFHDWNARIHAECYRANAYARIFSGEQKIKSLVNNYARMSFDFGPTLARWLERHDPHAARRIQEGDAAQRESLGWGGAIAQVWAHPITPLLSTHDKRTQIAWGLADFRRRFGREADGIWLPETAVDGPTLEALINAGLRYTIVAPEQIAAVKRPGKDWANVDAATVDSGRLYRWNHPDGSGRYIALAVFDGPLSRDLAFGNASRDALSLLGSIRKSADRSSAEGSRLVLAASDGELYGHHKKFADLTLAYAAHIASASAGIEVTNLSAFLSQFPPSWEVRLHSGPNGEGTAWSCSHGLGRWRRHCGCAMHADKGTSQAWRGPLRDALDLLRDRAANLFEDMGGDLFGDPWLVRDLYGDFIDAPHEERTHRLQALGQRGLKHGQVAASRRAVLLMEMQRSLLLMYASCGWFFDDIAGIESQLDLRRAAHAIDLWRELGGRPPEAAVLDVLAKAKSNTPGAGTGADVYRRVCLSRVTPAHAVARAAFSAMLPCPTDIHRVQVPGFEIAFDSHVPAPPAHPSISGHAAVTHQRTGETARVAFTASHDRRAGFECKAAGDRLTLADLDDDAAQALRLRVLEQLGEQAETPEICAAMLEIVQSTELSPADETAALSCIFVKALVKFLGTLDPGTNDRATWEMVSGMAERAALPVSTDDGRRIQDMIWEHLEHFQDAKRHLPRPLRALAQKIGFDIT